jgi:hypothetical protein
VQQRFFELALLEGCGTAQVRLLGTLVILWRLSVRRERTENRGERQAPNPNTQRSSWTIHCSHVFLAGGLIQTFSPLLAGASGGGVEAEGCGAAGDGLDAESRAAGVRDEGTLRTGTTVAGGAVGVDPDDDDPTAFTATAVFASGTSTWVAPAAFDGEGD